ncbi:site-2 protease family protein [Thermococcus gorgonarius]|uniref:Metalloprotease n=1 Tax=Thermococcus gorgonarius TaxID=71997 RepID=A0A2Z2MGQ8_THEGO|nr:site-2 protease family protein [Thermococcus gorgonarius]ASJ01651.1 metalloprotease [Thermococcus gorgonarius]
MVSPGLIIGAGAVLAFWAVLYGLSGKREVDPLTGEPIEKEEGLEVDLFVAMWRTKRLLGFIDRTASRARKFWKVYGDVGIVLGFLGMAYVFYALFKTAIRALQAGGKQAGVQLVIPGLTIPLWYGLIGLIVVMVVHELSHGVVARADGLPLKSVGLVLLFIIPGAFVEPDEEELKKAPLRTRLRVYGAGSLANVITALIALLLINFAITPLFQPAGVEIAGVIDNGPASGLLMKGDVIKAINGQTVTTMDDFIRIMNSTKPGEIITLTVLRDGEQKTFQIELGKHPDDPEKGFIGIYPVPHYVSKIGYDRIVFPVFFALYWIYVLDLGIGLMNLFPLVPLDGGRMLDDLLKGYLPEKIAKPARYVTIGVGLVLLALNLWPAIMNLVR